MLQLRTKIVQIESEWITKFVLYDKIDNNLDNYKELGRNDKYANSICSWKLEDE
jgi:hypothetical protein